MTSLHRWEEDEPDYVNTRSIPPFKGGAAATGRGKLDADDDALGDFSGGLGVGLTAQTAPNQYSTSQGAVAPAVARGFWASLHSGAKTSSQGVAADHSNSSGGGGGWGRRATVGGSSASAAVTVHSTTKYEAPLEALASVTGGANPPSAQSTAAAADAAAAAEALRSAGSVGAATASSASEAHGSDTLVSPSTARSFFASLANAGAAGSVADGAGGAGAQRKNKGGGGIVRGGKTGSVYLGFADEADA